MNISIIVTTYNRPNALERVLTSLVDQEDKDFEILIADDGSDSRTTNLISTFKLKNPINHVWQEDNGFRAAMIRNKAVAKAKGDYIVFIDGDCMVRPNFVSRHRKLAEQGYFLAGNRVLLSEQFTQKILTEKIAIHNQKMRDFFEHKKQGHINRILPLLTIPLGLLRKIKSCSWYGVKTCNLAVWKKDFYAVNGFDEAYVGWGYEDSDLVIRLLRCGLRRKIGKYSVPVLHLWHPENDQSHEQENLKRLNSIQHVCAVEGVRKYS